MMKIRNNIKINKSKMRQLMELYDEDNNDSENINPDNYSKEELLEIIKKQDKIINVLHEVLESIKNHLQEGIKEINFSSEYEKEDN